MTKEIVLFGKRKDDTEDWHEEILLTNATPELIEKVKVLAAKDGFHSFRVAEIDLSSPPNFATTLRLQNFKRGGDRIARAALRKALKS